MTINLQKFSGITYGILKDLRPLAVTIIKWINRQKLFKAATRRKPTVTARHYTTAHNRCAHNHYLHE